MLLRPSHSIFFLSSLVFSIGTQDTHARLMDKIVAVVGNEVVTLSDLKAFRKDVQRINALQFSEQIDPKKLEKDSAVLDLLIKERLLEQAVKKHQLTATDDEIEITINRIQKQNKIARAQLRQALEEQGMSFEVFRENVKKQIEKQNLMQKEVRQKVQITEQDIYNYYLTQNKGQGETAHSFRFSHILLKTATHGGKPKTLQLARKIIDSINRGENFAVAAEKHSEDRSSAVNGGDLGVFQTGSLDAHLEKVLRGLKVNEVSAPVVSGNSVHILKLTERTILGDQNFEKQKESIRQVLQQQEFNRQLELWFATQREQAHVKSLL